MKLSIAAVTELFRDGWVRLRSAYEHSDWPAAAILSTVFLHSLLLCLALFHPPPNIHLYNSFVNQGW